MNANFKIYPNPASAVLNIEMTHFNTAKTTLYDLNGRVLKSQTVEEGTTQMNISDVATGIYLLKIDTKNGSLTKQIIKE